ncbi:MAG: Ig-like domain-containing protein, partial [Lachnospiraceae bacterium]|nr:Ig-like domain-containing protein [Lachnospiraceae bacterium]
MKRKALSLLLALSMVFTAVPTTVNAEEIGTYEVTEEADSQVDETEAESKETDVAETTESETAVEENSSEENISEEMQTTVEDGSVEDTEASTEETLEALAENGQVSGQVSAKMFGSDGIEYEGVAYLSEANVLAMSEENQKAYQEMCDDIAQMKADNSDVRDIVISVDEEGVLGYSYFVPYHTVSDYQLEMAGINESEVEIISIDELADKLTEEATEETIVQETTEESTVEESTQEKTTEESTVEESTQEKTTEEESTVEESTQEKTTEEESTVEESTEEESTVEETTEEETTEEETTVEETTEEETTEEETTVEETEAVVANAVNAVFAENVSLAQANAIEEEYIGDEFTKIESILPTNTYFKNQLDSVGTAVYNAGLSSIVNGGSNSIKVSLSSMNSSSISDGLSALILTYPAKFDWTSKSGGWSARGYYRSGHYDATITVVKSRHYNSSLESSAQKKVKEIKEKAFEYAKKNYPSNQTYGIVKYFDKWICENNYYNYPSLNMTDSNSIFFYCHSSYGALLKGYGVCESFALATSRLLDAAGIPNIYVVGDAGGGHAWNYVQMPDGKWYLLDTTWDNPSSSPSNASKGSTGEYLLVKNDGVHRPTGKGYTNGKKFSFPSLSKNNYNPASEKDFLIAKTLLLEQGKSKQVAKVGSYYKHFNKKYSSSNTKVATIDKKGVVKAVGVGQATITVTVGAISSQMNVKVYKANALKFVDNDKSSYKFEYGDTDGKFDSKDVFTKEIRLDVKQLIRISKGA